MRAVSQAQKLHLTQESVHKDVKRVGQRDKASLFGCRDKWLYKLAFFIVNCPIFSPKNWSRNRGIVFLGAVHFITPIYRNVWYLRISCLTLEAI